ncbi:hypothetical protein NN561_001869 [Cricetulus griseus]
MAAPRHRAGLPGDPGSGHNAGAQRPGSGLPEACEPEPGSSCTGSGGPGGGGAPQPGRRTRQNDLPRSPRDARCTSARAQA